MVGICRQAIIIIVMMIIIKIIMIFIVIHHQARVSDQLDVRFESKMERW